MQSYNLLVMDSVSISGKKHDMKPICSEKDKETACEIASNSNETPGDAEYNLSLCLMSLSKKVVDEDELKRHKLCLLEVPPKRKRGRKPLDKTQLQCT